ncbi:archemetzincin [Candidatus Bathyarchaeota archaeon]|nr:archaemetzincin family Zn-dependent metalloprotease [Candidatus Bathyarchaeota archaeon]RJS82938.1 MAG: archemetzincin [Candidatus Bathyarchaeota archaeon]RLI20031.1 MAG: archemetzincin [Candidatus Bathyarchaeota archaeon]
MKVSVTPIGKFDLGLAEDICIGVSKVIPKVECFVEDFSIDLPREYYNPIRGQYHSTMLLYELESRTRASTSHRILGVTEVDIYVPGMNFIFGEARLPGRCCLISTFRLRPELYGLPRDRGILLERCVKEALHELGHTLGLQHCPLPLCVMHFSLNVYSVDRKKPDFCRNCRSKLERFIEAI